jgi:hypothetical protein
MFAIRRKHVYEDMIDVFGRSVRAERFIAQHAIQLENALTAPPGKTGTQYDVLQILRRADGRLGI